MKTYSTEIRQQVLDACDAGTAPKQVAARFGVSPAWIRRLRQRRREVGYTTACPAGGDRRTILNARVVQWLAVLLVAEPQIRLTEVQHRIEATFSIRCSRSTVARAKQRVSQLSRA